MISAKAKKGIQLGGVFAVIISANIIFFMNYNPAKPMAKPVAVSQQVANDSTIVTIADSTIQVSRGRNATNGTVAVGSCTILTKDYVVKITQKVSDTIRPTGSIILNYSGADSSR